MSLWAWRAGEWGRRALGRFYGRAGPRLSAAVAYYVLLSLFPLVLVVTSVAGLVLSDPGTRADFVGALVDALPVSASGADSIESVVRGVSDSAGAVGLVSLAGLLWTSSGMMAALRGGLDEMMGTVGAGLRPFLQGKLVDLLMLLAATLLLVASAGATIAARVAEDQVVDPLGLNGLLLAAARVAVPVAAAFGVLLILLRWVPSTAPAMRHVWPSALTGAVALWALTLGFAEFVNRFGNYNVVYGSIAAVVVFLVYIYLASYIVFLSAAFAADRQEVAGMRPDPDADGPGLRAEVLRFLRGLVVRD